MASASAPVDLEEIECSICHELFTDPKLLPCGHCLCRHCLLSWLDSQSQAAALCPLCRCAIVECAQQRPKSFDDIADNFTTDLAMASLVDAHRLLLKDHQCCVCDDVAAASLCLQCGDMLCAQCTQAHKKLTMSKHHSVEALSSLTAETIASHRRGSCAVHAGKETELFCPKHGESICQLCAMSKHRSCPEVMDLDEKMVEARAVLAELVDTLTAGENKLDCRIRQLDEHIKQTEEQAQVAISEIEAVCARLHKSIKEREDHLIYFVDSSRSDITKAASDKKTYLSQRRGQLTTHKRVVERVQDARSPDTVANMTPKLKKRVVNLDPTLFLTTDAKGKVLSRLTLMIDPKAVIIIEDGLSKLGQKTNVLVDVTFDRQEMQKQKTAAREAERQHQERLMEGMVEDSQMNEILNVVDRPLQAPGPKPTHPRGGANRGRGRGRGRFFRGRGGGHGDHRGHEYKGHPDDQFGKSEMPPRFRR